jgi:hypothetical protein
VTLKRANPQEKHKFGGNRTAWPEILMQHKGRNYGGSSTLLGGPTSFQGMPERGGKMAQIGREGGTGRGTDRRALRVRAGETQPDRARLMRLSIVCGGILTVFPIDFARRGQFGCWLLPVAALEVK